MKMLNSPLLAFTLLAGFICLSYYSYNRDTGYTYKQVSELKHLQDRALTPEVDTGVLFRPKNELEAAETIASIWGIK